jgi:hypothetical protein
MLVAGVRTLDGKVETLEVDEPRPLAADEVLIDVRGAGVGNWDNIGREWSSAHDLLVVAFEVLAAVGFLEDFVWGLGPDEGGAIEVVPAGIHPLSYSPLRHTVSP